MLAMLAVLPKHRKILTVPVINFIKVTTDGNEFRILSLGSLLDNPEHIESQFFLFTIFLIQTTIDNCSKITNFSCSKIFFIIMLIQELKQLICQTYRFLKSKIIQGRRKVK